MNKLLSTHRLRLFIVIGMIFLGIIISSDTTSATNTNNPSQIKIHHSNSLAQEYSDNLTISIDPKGGLYGTPKLVKLTLNKHGTIYYTLNGQDPTHRDWNIKTEYTLGKPQL